MTATGTASATVSVQASNYSVVVAAWAPCWTVVHSPQSFSPIFAATLQGGQVKVFDPTDGQLSVSMSASLVTVQVRVNGKTVPGWLFKPTSVPFLLNFSSSTTSSCARRRPVKSPGLRKGVRPGACAGPRRPLPGRGSP